MAKEDFDLIIQKRAELEAAKEAEATQVAADTEFGSKVADPLTQEHEFYDTKTGGATYVKPGMEVERLLKGEIAAKKDQRYNVVGPDGNSASVLGSELSAAVDRGYTLEDPKLARQRQYLEQGKGIGGAIDVGAAEFFDAAAMGLPSLIAGKTGPRTEDTENFEALTKEHSVAAGTGAVLGTAASLVTGGPLFKAASKAGAAAEGFVAGGKALKDLSLGARIATNAARTGVEGLVIGTPHAVTEAMLGDPQEAAESLLWSLGTGTVLGGLGGAVSHTVEKVAPKVSRFLVDKADEAAAKALDPKLKGAEAKALGRELQELGIVRQPKLGFQPEKLDEYGLRITQRKESMLADLERVGAAGPSDELTKLATKVANLEKVEGLLAKAKEGAAKADDLSLSNALGLGEPKEILGKAYLITHPAAIPAFLGGTVVSGMLKGNKNELVAKYGNQLGLALSDTSLSHASERLSGVGQAMRRAGLASSSKLKPDHVFGDFLGKSSGNLEQVTKRLEIVATDPEKFMEQVSGGPARTIADGAPEAASAYAAHLTKVAGWLHNEAPKAPVQSGPFPQQSKWKPSRAETSAFAQKVAVVQDPSVVVKAIADGTLTENHVKALDAAYPILGSYVRHQILEAAQDPKVARSMTGARRRKAMMLFGMADENVADFQALYGQPSQLDSATPAQSGGNKPRQLNIKKLPGAAPTNEQRLSSGA